MARRSSARVVAITGASSGIGRATAREFARRGWLVGLIARNADTLEETRRDVRRLGSHACVAVADVADAPMLEAAAARIERELGPIDVWINDAGTSFYGNFEDITEAEFNRVTHVTYLGAVNGTRSALRRMKPRNRGTIVNICSAIAYRAAPLQSPYSGAKYALRGFTEAVRSELIHDRSRVHLTMVHPPAVNTPFFAHAGARLRRGEVPRPPPPIYQPEIVADAVYFAATHRRREIKVGGASVLFAVGNKFAPGFSDWAFGRAGRITQVTRDRQLVAMQDQSTFRPHSKSSDAHGPFDAESIQSSLQMVADKHPLLLTLGLGAAALAALGARQATMRGAAR